jgi:hypothetical protein
MKLNLSQEEFEGRWSDVFRSFDSHQLQVKQVN